MKNCLLPIAGRHRMELLVAGFSFLCWGRLLGMEGIWWDDWAWVWHYFGTESFEEFIQPFKWLKHTSVGLSFFLNFKMFDLFHEQATHVWGVFRFIIFTANAILLYSVAKNVLREKVMLPAAISFIYLSLPAVNHLTLSTYTYHFFLFFYLLSLLLAVKAVTENGIRPGLYLLSIVFALYSMVSLESFIFFDVLRPVLFLYVFLCMRSDLRTALKRSLLFWTPFLVVGVAVLADFFLGKQTGPYSSVYSTGAISGDFLVTVLSRYLNSLKYIFAGIYLITFRQALILINDRSSLVIIVSAISAAYASFALTRERAPAAGQLSVFCKEAKLAAAFGLAAVILGLLPYMLAREAVGYEHQSRHGLLAAVGAAIFFPSLLLTLYYEKIIGRTFCGILSGLLIFLGVLQCNYTVGVYKSTWEHQRSIWWQLIWRAPDIKPHTFVIIDMPWGESPGGGSYVLPPALNLAYARSRDKSEIFSHYAFAPINAFRKDETDYTAVADKDFVEFMSYRGPMKFYPRNLLAASYREGYLYMNEEITEPVSASRSDLEFMLSHAKNDRIIYEDPGLIFPLRWILGPEPEHDWRYFYQKANALSGRGDYQGIINLYNEALGAGHDLSIVLPQNLMPFIKAFYMNDEVEIAGTLLEKWSLSPHASPAMAVKLLGPDDPKQGRDIYKWINKNFGGSL